MAKKETKKKKQKREISVGTSYLRHTKDTLFGDTTGVERFNAFKISTKIGKLISVPIIAIGTILSILSAHFVVTTLFNIASISFLNLEIFFTPAMRPLLIGTIGLLGAINIVCGLILLARK